MENTVSIHIIPSAVGLDTVMVYNADGKPTDLDYVVDYDRGAVTFGTWEDALRARDNAA